MKTGTYDSMSTPAGFSWKALPKWLGAIGLVGFGYFAADGFVRMASHDVAPARVLVVAPDTANAAVDMDGAIHSGIAALSSPAVLRSAATMLGLAAKPGFVGTDPEKTLLADLDIHREPDAPVIAIGVKNIDPGTGVAIANRFASLLTDEVAGIVPAGQSAQAPDATRIHAELAAFEHGDGAATGELQQAILAGEQSFQQTDAQLEDARRLAAGSTKATFAEALSGRLPADLMTPRLDMLLARLPQAKAGLEALSQKFGPLHPQLQARKIEVDKIEASIREELNSISANAARRVQLLAAQRASEEKALTDNRARLDAIEQKRQALTQQARDADATVPAAAAPSLPENARYRLISEARSAGPDDDTSFLYRAEGTLLGLLAGLVFLLRVRRKEERLLAASRAVSSVPDKTMPRNFLDQVAMLEDMWPDTGRAVGLPVAANDDPVQRRLAPARRVVADMASLRRQARQAAHDPSAAALEQVLSDMQKLKAKVQFHAAMQERQRSAVAAIRPSARGRI